MSVAGKFGGATLAKLAMHPTPDTLRDRWGNSLRLQLGGSVQIWCMDAPELASPPSAEGSELTRCDFAVFQGEVPANKQARRLSLVEFMNSIGGDTAEKVERQFNGGLRILRELAEDGTFLFDALAPILVHGGTLGKADAAALGRIQVKSDRPVVIMWCKSGSVLKDGGVIEGPVK